MLKILKGDLFANLPERRKDSVIFVPHIVNNTKEKVIGGGFTRPLITKWPIVKTRYKQYSGILGNVDTIVVEYLDEDDDLGYETICVCNMYAQDGIISKDNPKPIKYEALVNCMVSLREQQITKNDRIVTIPFGGGLAGGTKEFIYELMEEIWAGFDVTVYDNQTK